jgi:hypothetical protein
LDYVANFLSRATATEQRRGDESVRRAAKFEDCFVGFEANPARTGLAKIPTSNLSNEVILWSIFEHLPEQLCCTFEQTIS